MSYAPKIIKGRLKTGGKTIAQIREENKGQGLTYRDFENIQRASEQFAGLIIYLSLWEYDNYGSYHLYGWDDKDDERMMMGMYYAEQTHPFPQYKGKLEKFIADWKSKKYDPGLVFGFSLSDVEELEVLQEEIKEARTYGKEKEAVQAFKKRKKKRKKNGKH